MGLKRQFPSDAGPEDVDEDINEETEDEDEYEDIDEDDLDEGELDEDADDSPEGDDENLECDDSSYVFFQQITTDAPCLSFDVLKDDLGDNRDKFPLAMTLIGGTQSNANHTNSILVMKLSNMNPGKNNANQNPNANEEDGDSDEDSEDEDQKPELEFARIRHVGCVNRLKVSDIGGTPVVASWSESGRVCIWDLSSPLSAVHNHHLMANYVKDELSKPLFSFNGHGIEGYGLAWSKLVPGMLATGDCSKNVHLWKMLEGGSWHVDQRPFQGHTASVEDIQWSPNESNVMATCSCDKSIRIWDVRASPERACMLAKTDAHDKDVNVISWNAVDPLILSGGDDGQIKVWDLRSFPNGAAVCTFKFHTAPITSVEWNPNDSSVYAASGADNQISLWDLAVEPDTDLVAPDEEEGDTPQQLLFVHKGQKDIKEVHWHPQMPGVLISTAHGGFDVFRTISV